MAARIKLKDNARLVADGVDFGSVTVEAEGAAELRLFNCRWQPDPAPLPAADDGAIGDAREVGEVG